MEQLRVKLAKVEKEKVKLQVEIRDLSIEYETVSNHCINTSKCNTNTCDSQRLVMCGYTILTNI